MDADEQDICNFLKTWPKQFVAVREICRKAGGKKRFREDPYWAHQVVLRLAEKGLIEGDRAGHYRLVQPKKKDTRVKWVSPQVKQILKRSGKQFDEVIDLGEPEDYVDEKG